MLELKYYEMRKLFIATTFLLFACAEKKINKISGMPPCMVSKIEEMLKAQSANQPQVVTQYSYKGAAVFYITSGCCDQYNPVYSSDCQYLGAPDGGITGKGDGRLPDFYTNTTNKKIVWENK